MLVVWIVLWALAGLLALLLVLLLWTLLARTRIRLDSFDNTYQIGIRALVKGEFSFSEESIVRVRFYIFGIGMTVYPSKEKRKKKEAKPQAKKTEPDSEPQEKKPSPAPSFAAIRKLLSKERKAFRLRRLYAEIDTGDFTVNAQVSPLFYTLNGNTSKRIEMNINYQGVNGLILIVDTRLIKMALPIIAFFIRLKRTPKSKRKETKERNNGF